VTLRPFVAADAEQIDAACQDPMIQRFIPIPRPYHRADAVAYIARTQRQWASGEKAAFAIADTTDPPVVLGAINLAVAGACGNAAYWIVPAVRGFGIATRALHLLTDWGVRELGLGVILLEIHRDNAGSLHVAEASGYHLAGQIEVNATTGERNHLLLAHLAADPAS
jgi:RimJ/RimL family protein N-acetyltransferase